MDRIMAFPLSGAGTPEEATETTSPTDGTDAGKGFHDDDYIVKAVEPCPECDTPGLSENSLHAPGCPLLNFEKAEISGSFGPENAPTVDKPLEGGEWIAHDSRVIKTESGVYDGIKRSGPPHWERDNTPIEMYTARELQAVLNLTYRGTLAWLAKNVTPIGGTVRVGRRNLYHRWAVNAALDTKKWEGLRHKRAGRSISMSRYWGKNQHLSKKQSSE